MGSRVCPGPGARSARALGAGGSRPALQDAPPPTGRSGQAGLSRPSALVQAPPRGCRPRSISNRIVLHIGERSETLLPKDAGARARAMQWLVAALNSIEPFVMNVALIDLFYAKEAWAKLRRPGAVAFVQKRLSALSHALGDKPYLDGERFTAGDLMMTTVLRIREAHRYRHERRAARWAISNAAPRGRPSSEPSMRRSAISGRRPSLRYRLPPAQPGRSISGDRGDRRK